MMQEIFWFLLVNICYFNACALPVPSPRISGLISEMAPGFQYFAICYQLKLAFISLILWWDKVEEVGKKKTFVTLLPLKIILFIFLINFLAMDCRLLLNLVVWKLVRGLKLRSMSSQRMKGGATLHSSPTTDLNFIWELQISLGKWNCQKM